MSCGWAGAQTPIFALRGVDPADSGFGEVLASFGDADADGVNDFAIAVNSRDGIGVEGSVHVARKTICPRLLMAIASVKIIDSGFSWMRSLRS